MAKADPYELGRCTSEPTQEPKIQHAWFNRKKREWSTYSQSSSYSAPLSKRTVECLLTFSIVASRFSYLLVVVRIYACTKQPFDADCHRLLLLFAVSITPSPKQPIYRERCWRAERLSPQMDFCTYYDLLGNHQPIFVHHHVPPSQVWTYALKIRSSCLSFFTFFRMSHWKVANSMGYSYDFPMVSTWCSYDFPMISPWFSHGTMPRWSTSPSITRGVWRRSPGSQSYTRAPRSCPCFISCEVQYYYPIDTIDKDIKDDLQALDGDIGWYLLCKI